MKSFQFLSSLFEKSVITVFALLFLIGCKKTTETLETASLQEMMPLSKGKYIIYRVDSLVFQNNFPVTMRYQFKHSIDSLGVDNLNRPMWIINTFINDSLASGPWVQSGQYTVTVLDKQIEVNENNLRVIKVKLPVKESFTWPGNIYLPDKPYAAYATTLSISLWDFTYTDVSRSEKIGPFNLTDVTTITQFDESRGVPVTDRTKYASQERSIEKYAKGIGMVYREHFVWENQPNERTGGNPPVTSYNPQYVGFGIKMWMVAKN
jgi:hypothetical protein